MSTIRFAALKESQSRKPVEVKEISASRSELYGVNVFNDSFCKKFMTKDAYAALKDAMVHGKKIDRKIADQVASAMKAWAMTKGATHYTHWFQPLTGATAEKHDAFFEPAGDGTAIDKFDGGQLVQQEPDASSFPNGGIRNTFEARGYTAWDPTSPAFVIATTLCIPTVFVSYTGEALDNKTPLLRALQSIDHAATEVAQYFDKNVHKVIATLGWEQEYFLIDSALATSRPDIVLTGRVLLGQHAAKGQQLEDHYFGSIPERALAFMRELEIESIQLGIPVKTRHNEVAPNQFELAPIFEEANLSVDHNSLIMDVMNKVAARHNLKVLFHEKPFDGINGSGKHNNWSLATDTGVNLLSPGKTPKSNLMFLTYFINTIKAVHRYADLLRASIASASNDFRLGANEAPPAIVSVFIGQQLTAVLDELERVKDGNLSPEEKTDLKLNVVGKIPEILLDNTDRNRTSPFAFTGNKFEFRAVGSSANCAKAMTVVNTIVAQQLTDFKKDVDSLIEKKGLKKDDAIFNVLREYIKESKMIRFEGDGYSDNWVKEAKKRGLSNLKNTPEALRAQITPEVKKLWMDNGVMNDVEIMARYEIEMEEYVKKVQIEGRVLGDIATNHVIPTAINYQNRLILNVQGLKDIFGKDFEKYAGEQIDIIKEISSHITGVKSNVDKMIEERKKANKIDHADKRADAYCHKVKPYFDVIRYHSDKLELMVDDELWPLTKYRELLFTR
ncbi:MAG: glutamine synthetase III [Saprospiraceae bacterium]|nr:glutamine synthetase III [Saprospiraceae bacterium]MBK8373191.1 glutamine synthetase III [Saprospiraceae bacterium]MBK8820653.1 glutamine synthetase III [Saprospiraceae bacterium]MBK9044962.1 glutamine synthetase III [Saprospiraceae bacterium]